MHRTSQQKKQNNSSHKKKCKSQNITQNDSSDQVILKIRLSQNEQIYVPVPSGCPLKIINTLLKHKVTEFKKQQVIGFQCIPSDNKFDYKLSKGIGILSQNKNICLKCLYKNQELIELIKKQQEQLSNSLLLTQHSFFKINKYKICRSLSSGGFSRVYLVRNVINGQFYAAKFMDKRSQVNHDRVQAIRNQYQVHKSLDHPYIVKMEEYIQTDQFYILIMEYCPGGQLFNLLKHNRYMGQQKAKVLFLQVLLAIKYLHDKNIIFRDIKPQNILIDEKGNAKLTDFGLAKQIRSKTNSYCGSVQYMAPQIVSKQTYSFQVDLYCMGALLYQILIGCPPFYNPSFSNNETKYHICNSEVSFPNKVPLSSQVKNLISKLLIKTPSQRFGHDEGVDQILQHPWIGDIDMLKYLNKQVKCPFVPDLQAQNFDRQDDIYENQFRLRITQDMKYCKRHLNSLIVSQKFKFINQTKLKSRSLGVNYKKYSKSHSQQEFASINRKQLVVSNKNSPNKCKVLQKSNPYHFSLSKNQIQKKEYKNSKNHNSIQPVPFKKKSIHRSLSRSLNRKSQYQPTYNQQMKNSLLVNSKSYSNSRKNSVYKRFVKNQHNQSQSNKIDFLNPKNHKKLLSSKNLNCVKQEEKNKQKCKQQQISLTTTKETKEKKQLKRKGVGNKKKFNFASASQNANSFQKYCSLLQKQNRNSQARMSVF